MAVCMLICTYIFPTCRKTLKSRILFNNEVLYKKEGEESRFYEIVFTLWSRNLGRWWLLIFREWIYWWWFLQGFVVFLSLTKTFTWNINKLDKSNNADKSLRRNSLTAHFSASYESGSTTFISNQIYMWWQFPIVAW